MLASMMAPASGSMMADELAPHEQFDVLLRHLLRMNPEAIPLKPDGRRISRGEARRRLAMRRIDRRARDEN
jgi:hypothetical protein